MLTLGDTLSSQSTHARGNETLETAFLLGCLTSTKGVDSTKSAFVDYAIIKVKAVIYFWLIQFHTGRSRRSRLDSTSVNYIGSI